MNLLRLVRACAGALALASLLAALGQFRPGAPASAASTFAASAIVTSPLGTNTDFFRYYSSEYATVDAFKQSRPWLTQCSANVTPGCTYANAFDTHESADLAARLDGDGWVMSLPQPADPPTYTIAGTTMLGGIGGHYPAGQYVVLYDGSGTLAYGGDAVKNNALSAAHRDVLDVTPTNGGIYLQITATDPFSTGDYIRNIRVLMPGFEASYATQIFHPDFLSRIAPYRIIRFKDWLETDASTQSSWATRSLSTTARWGTAGGAGLPIEAMLELANRLNADAWVNMPHMADDDYMTQFAALARDRLAPGLKVYVEYSNEVWNGSPGFTQSYWVQAQGVARWGASDPFTKQINWHGMRSAQMCDIWKSVWGAQSGRVVCVMGAQGGNWWTAWQALDCPLWTEGRPCYQHGIDAVAIGPYFGAYIGNSQYVTTWVNYIGSEPDGGVSKVFEEISAGGVLSGGPAGGALVRAQQEISLHMSVVLTRGLSLVAYEGGQHLYSTVYNTAVISLFNTVNHDARMGAVYDQYLANWKSAGGRAFVHFKNVAAPNSYGAFGALDFLDQSTSPKYDALMRFAAANPCWWPSCAVASHRNYLPMLLR